MSDVDLMLRFLLQLVLVLAACKAVGLLGQRYLGQTQVVMEMVTGVLLGPSVLGAISPQAQAWLFPSQVVGSLNGQPVRHPSMAVLYVIAQLGLVFYMFLIGLEFNVALVADRVRGAVRVSLAGIVTPFVLGAALALLLTRIGVEGLFSPSVRPMEAALFMGAAMCITAFPMLARILYENGIAQTTMGTLALGAGATDDASAWAILALVLASFRHDARYAVFAILGGATFAALNFTVGRRLLTHFERSVEREGKLTSTAFITAMVVLFVAAYATDAIGIYAVFGAFMAGAAMPRGKFASEVRARLEGVTVGVLLPFFFVYSGLNTKLGLLNTPLLWCACLLACGVAVFGKLVGCAVAARQEGISWRESLAIGTLMNARGLMELIILNIGLQQGVITPTLFTMLVVMAIVTTLMASPLFRVIYGRAAHAMLGGEPLVAAP